jgi:hypothetical protein
MIEKLQLTESLACLRIENLFNSPHTSPIKVPVIVRGAFLPLSLLEIGEHDILIEV